MSLIEKLDEVLAIRAEWENVPATELRANEWEDLKLAAARLLRDHGPAIRQAMLKADLWDKHSGSFSVLEAMLDAASPLVLNKLKAIDAARAAGEERTPPGSCPCGLTTCDEPWEPGCGLGTVAEFAKVKPE